MREAVGLLVVEGDPVAEVACLAPDVVYLSRDVSAHAQRREGRLGSGSSCARSPGSHHGPGRLAPGRNRVRVVPGAYVARCLPERFAYR